MRSSPQSSAWSLSARTRAARTLGRTPSTATRRCSPMTFFKLWGLIMSDLSGPVGDTRPTIGDLVREFHRAFGIAVRSVPVAAPPESDLRTRLLAEEVQEYYDAVEAGDVVAVADGLADIVYVAYGTALNHGIDLDAVLVEVHRSNMSKLGADGRPILRDDGKVIK